MKSFVLEEQQPQEYGVLRAKEHPVVMRPNQNPVLRAGLEGLLEVVAAGLAEAWPAAAAKELVVESFVEAEAMELVAEHLVEGVMGLVEV